MAKKVKFGRFSYTSNASIVKTLNELFQLNEVFCKILEYLEPNSSKRNNFTGKQ